MREEDIFRTTLKEGRAEYFVEYTPADEVTPFALVQLSFPAEVPQGKVVQAMEDEFKHWLGRFVVPIMVSSFDAKGVTLSLQGYAVHNHLMGYRDASSENVVKVWGSMNSSEMPASQQTPEYRQEVYRNIPYRRKSEVQEKAGREVRNRKWLIWTGLFFVVVVPVLVELVALKFDWLDKIISGASICYGLWKTGKAFGWIPQSKRERKNAEKKILLEHYFYHCERNSEGFKRLKFENFDREETEKTKKEAQSLRKS